MVLGNGAIGIKGGYVDAGIYISFIEMSVFSRDTMVLLQKWVSSSVHKLLYLVRYLGTFDLEHSSTNRDDPVLLWKPQL